MGLFNLNGENEISKIRDKEPRELTDKEAEFLADYFHNQEHCPDYDGFVGRAYYLPEKVMVIYRKKYGQMRGW